MDNSLCGLDGESEHCWRYGEMSRKCSFCGKIQYASISWKDEQSGEQDG